MDRTLVNIASLLVGAVGIFTALTKFNVAELNASFWGENPFAIKHDAIESAVNWVFASVAMLGILLQLWAEIWGSHLPERNHEPSYYLRFSAVGLLVLAILVWLLTAMAYRIARVQWLPKVIASQAEIFERAQFVIDHDGWTPEHFAAKDSISAAGDAERYKRGNLEVVDRDLQQLEQLLEINPAGDRKARIQELAPYFER